MRVAALVNDLFGDDLPIRVEAWDGSALGPPDAPARVLVQRREALRRIVMARGELGFARAYVAGDIEVEGDIFAALALRERVPHLALRPRNLVRAATMLRPGDLLPLPRPAEEIAPRGRRHTQARDAAAVQHHYDVGNEFYRLVLGPALTYSCAVFGDEATTLEEAQDAKHDLVARKLGLREGARLLDVGCGWGSMALRAAAAHGATVVGVTLSEAQAALARARVDDAGLAGRVEVRIQDYRDIDDGPFDAVSSIGMFEHVGRDRAPQYFARLFDVLRPGGRLLNHAIARPPGRAPRLSPRSFAARYVFPDGELLELGDTITLAQDAGFEVRHSESLREHYGLTLRSWVANLEREWDRAVDEVGLHRARIWRLYMAGSALLFEAGEVQIHQVLAVRPAADGSSGMAGRPDW